MMFFYLSVNKKLLCGRVVVNYICDAHLGDFYKRVCKHTVVITTTARNKQFLLKDGACLQRCKEGLPERHQCVENESTYLEQITVPFRDEDECAR